MTASTATNTTAAWQSLSTTISAFRGECSDLEQLMAELFTQAESLHAELLVKSGELETLQARLADREQQLASQRAETQRLSGLLEQQESQALAEIARLREDQQQLFQQQAERGDDDDTQLRVELEEARKQRNQWYEQLESARAEVSRLAGVTQELAAARGELIETREQVARLQGEVKLRSVASGNGGGADVAVGELREILERQESEWTRRFETLHDLQQQLLDGQAHGEPAVDSGLAGELEAARQQRDRWRTQLEEAQEKITRLATAAAELGDIRQELADLREEFARPADGVDGFDPERAALEAELNLVRARAAELYETVADQQRQLDEQRDVSGDELKRLRELIEQRAQTPVADVPPPQAATPVRTTEPAKTDSDPVVHSVMAQFEKLQKDVAQRRQRNR